jgi:hypothetical protein
VFLARRQDRVLAFTTWRPYRAGRAALLDLMRRRSDAPSGTMDLLVSSSLEALRDAGPRGGEPRQRPARERERAQERPREGRDAAASSTVNAFYGYRNLFQFKKKFAPRWEGRYLVYPRGELPHVAIALAHVHGRPTCEGSCSGADEAGARLLAAAGAALVAFALAIGFEREFVRLLSLDLAELEWLSDVVLLDGARRRDLPVAAPAAAPAPS